MWKDLTMSQRAEVIQMAVKNGMRDLNQIRSFYDESIGSGRVFAEGGDAKKNVSNTPKNREAYNRAVEGMNFINSYVQSPGFAKRLALLTKDYEINPEFKISPTIEIIKDGGSYSKPFADNGKVYINPEDEEVYDWGKYKRAYVYDRFGKVDFPRGMVSAHELGHILDAQLARSSNFRDKNPWYIPSKHLPVKTEHSGRYPQLIPSKKVNDHDKSKSESYADLIAFRKYLKDKGIYDSNSINDFTKKHLLKAKEAVKKNDEFIRLLHNFTDEEVINIMNTVAQNTMNSNNLLLDIYSKNMLANGGKIEKEQGEEDPPIDGGTLKQVTVTGYRPIELKTYYPLGKQYPWTGHSQLNIPITPEVADEYGLYDSEEIPLEERKQVWAIVDKKPCNRGYNFFTNNCADATLNYLNAAFGTKESPLLFTTPGDVRDYAIDILGGKKVKDKNGIETILIPRTKNNADIISRRVLNLLRNAPYMQDKGYTGAHLSTRANGGYLTIKKNRKR